MNLQQQSRFAIQTGWDEATYRDIEDKTEVEGMERSFNRRISDSFYAFVMRNPAKRLHLLKGVQLSPGAKKKLEAYLGRTVENATCS